MDIHEPVYALIKYLNLKIVWNKFLLIWNYRVDP